MENKSCGTCKYGCLTNDDICPVEKALREIANKFDSEKDGCSMWEGK
jgi:hypothetical protein